MELNGSSPIQRVYPPSKSINALSYADLVDAYSYSWTGHKALVRGSFVSSIDGASSVDGLSGGLSSDTDRFIFAMQREIADVVLIGSATAEAENYFGVRSTSDSRSRRLESGLSDVPPIAVISTGANLNPRCQLFTNTFVPPIVITTENAAQANKTSLRSAGAVVVDAGTNQVDLDLALAVLRDMGFTRILCEGGPKLFGSLLALDLVGDVCVTLSPLLAGGRSGRIAESPGPVAARMSLAHVLTAEDGTVLTRWVRPRTEIPAVDSLAP